ncbi:MAG: hypothetical protein HC830_11800 [Bacteroidetes bacterium]|nr:hypothetical protein [Bacteroidota bacterium]
MHYDQYLKTAILLNATYRNILGEGSRLLIDLKLGQFPGAQVQYTVHTFARPNIGLGIKMGVNSLPAKFYTPDLLLRENYNVQHFIGEIDLFSTVSKAFMIRTGIQGEVFNIDKEMEVNDTINFNANNLNWYARFRFDTQDRTVFPHKGDFFSSEIKYVMRGKYFNDLLWDKSFWRIIAWYTKYIPLHSRIVIIPSANGGFTFSKHIPVPFYNYLGGMLTSEMNLFPFDGLKYMTVSSPNVVTGSLALRGEPWKDKFITLKVNYAGVSDGLDNVPILPKAF